MHVGMIRGLAPMVAGQMALFSQGELQENKQGERLLLMVCSEGNTFCRRQCVKINSHWLREETTSQ